MKPLLSATCFCLLASLALGKGDDAAVAPIAVKPDAYVQRDYNRQQAAWERHLFVDGFHAHGRTGQPWDDEAEAFLDAAHALWSTQARDPADAEARKVHLANLTARGRRLVEGGCDDPVVRYHAGRLAAQQDANSRVPATDYEQALHRLEDAACPYPHAVAAAVGMALWDADEKCGCHDTHKDLGATVAAWERQSVDDGSYAAADDFIFVQRLVGPGRDGWRKANGEAVAAWLPDAPLPEWARETIEGYIEVDRAWKSRGGGWASTVTDNGWEGFRRHLTRASDVLTHAWELRPDRPEAPRLMMAVVGGGGPSDESMRTWFDRTTAAQFDYLPAYSEFLWYSRPRWGGSHAAMLAFGRACLATERFDTSVPPMLWSALDDIASELADWRESYRAPGVADDALRLSRGQVEEPSHRADRQALRSYQVINAYLVDRPADALQALAALAGEDGFKASTAWKLRQYGSDAPTMVSETLLLNGPAKEEYAHAASLDRDHEVEAAAAAYDAVLKKADADDTAGYVPRKRLRVLALERQLQTGGWVKMTPAAGLADWRTVSGKWSAADDGALQNEGTDAEALVVLPVRVGADFEVRGRFEADPVAGHNALGVVFGYDEGSLHGGDHWHTCEVWQNGSGPAATASLLDKFYQSNAPQAKVTLEAVNTFLVQCWEGHVSCYVNGQEMLKGYAPAYDGVVRREEAGPQIGFGANRSGAKRITRVRDIEVHRLTATPMPPASAEAAR